MRSFDPLYLSRFDEHPGYEPSLHPITQRPMPNTQPLAESVPGQRRGIKGLVPSVSIVVPCRNEGHYIEACVRSMLAQEPPPGGLEIIVADGMSDDGTRETLEQLVKEDARLRIIDNPGRTTPHGMNAGIREARGQYIAILGAHTEYASDYVRTCVELLEEHPEVCCSGGPIVSRGRGVFGQAVATAMSHPLGVGNAKHRFPNYEGYAEGACFPMFRREIFDKVGLYDEHLVRNQDDELNYRLAKAGEKIFISPRARCTYYVRESPSRLFWQYFQYGYWRVAVLRKHRLPASIRQLAPVALVFLMLASLIAFLLMPDRWRLAGLALPTAYFLTLITASAGIGMGRGTLVAMMFPIATPIMHLAYATGFLWGIFTSRSQGQKPRS